MNDNWKQNFPTQNIYYETDNGILYHGDSIKILKEFSNESIDFIFADYPFNCQDGRQDYVSFINTIVIEFYRILKLNCVLLTINNPKNVWKTFNSYIKFNHRDSIALIRKGALRPAWHFGFQHNYLITFIKGDDITYKWNGTKQNHDTSFLTDVIKYQNGFRMEGNLFHPQAISLELTKSMIEIFSNENDIILDPFMGSGTTAIVCERLNRKWVGIEFNELYCELIKKRLYKEKQGFVF